MRHFLFSLALWLPFAALAQSPSGWTTQNALVEFDSRKSDPNSDLEFMYAINDPEGHSFLRSSSSTQGTILGCISNGRIVYEDDFHAEGNWIKLTISEEMVDSVCGENPRTIRNLEYEISRKKISGYIHKSRLKRMSSLHPILASKKAISKQITFYKFDSVSLEVGTQKFHRQNHKVIKQDQINYLVDGHHVWGMDGGLPTFETRTFQIQVGTQPVEIRHEDFAPFYQIKSDRWEMFADDFGGLYLFADGSDGAGGYTVVYTIMNGTITSVSARISYFA
ncbi:MAG: hypothetical protein AAB214_13510 [Fibrobacterota bacterium]